MMQDSIKDVVNRLEEQAEAVCHHYLSAGKRQGNYWLVGDVRNTPGRSMYVRLVSSQGKRAGKWQDAATGEHGDLLDIIRETCRLSDFGDVMEEAQRFLGMTKPSQPTNHIPIGHKFPKNHKRKPRSPDAARKLFAMSKPIAGTFEQTPVHLYLAERGITRLEGLDSLRFHPSCYYRLEGVEDDTPPQTWPAMVASVTDNDGTITGVHRTWLMADPSQTSPFTIRSKVPLRAATLSNAPLRTASIQKALVRKAPVRKAPIRKAMGNLLGNAVRFGTADTVLLAGEGIETVLSLRQFLPSLPMVACLSANHLAAFRFSSKLQRLYIACDNDPPGMAAAKSLAETAAVLSIETVLLKPILSDFNDDLCQLSQKRFIANIRSQMFPKDFARFCVLT